MSTKRRIAPLGDQARLLIPVMAATGGAARSTVAGLIAYGFTDAGAGGAVVLDTAPRLASPWPGWATEAGSGLAGVPPDRPLTATDVRRAVSRCRVPSGDAAWDLLTDHRSWQNAPLPLPAAPEAWHQLSALGPWQAVVVDTAHPMAHDIVAERSAGHPGLTARWCRLPDAVPVMTTLATGTHIAALQLAVMAAEAEGLPLRRTVLAVSSFADSRPPSGVRAALTMLDRKLGAVVHVPYDASLRARGLRETARLRPATHKAAHELATAVAQLARATWGDPLPPGARPAVLPPTKGTEPRVPDPPRVAAPC